MNLTPHRSWLLSVFSVLALSIVYWFGWQEAVEKYFKYAILVVGGLALPLLLMPLVSLSWAWFDRLRGTMSFPVDTNMEWQLEQRGEKFALSLLDTWGAVLPIRIAKEELNGYIEDIHRRAEQGQRWRLWLRVITAIVWTGINAVGYLTKNLLGKQAVK